MQVFVCEQSNLLIIIVREQNNLVILFRNYWDFLISDTCLSRISLCRIYKSCKSRRAFWDAFRFGLKIGNMSGLIPA